MGGVLEKKAVDHAGGSAPVRLERTAHTFLPSGHTVGPLLSYSIADVALEMKEVARETGQFSVCVSK